MNLEVENVVAMTNKVILKLGDLSGIVSFTIVPMDDRGSYREIIPKEGKGSAYSSVIFF